MSPSIADQLPWIARKSIRFQLTLLSLLVTLITTTVTGALAYHQMHSATRNDAAQWATSVAMVGVALGRSHHRDQTTETLVDTYRDLMDLPEVTGITLVEKGYAIKLQLVKRPGLEPLVLFPRALTAQPPQDPVEFGLSPFGGEELTVRARAPLHAAFDATWNAIDMGTEPWIEVMVSYRAKAEATTDGWLRMMGLRLALISVALVLFFMVLTRITEPMICLAKFADEMATTPGQTTPLAGGSREVNLLARAMNDSSVRIKDQIDMIESQLQRQSALFDTAVDAIIGVDDNGLVVSANRASERVFGTTLSDMLGNPFSRFMPGVDAPYLAKEMERLSGFDHHRQLILERVGLRHRTPSTFPAELLVGQVSHDPHLRFTCIVRDLTALKAAEESLSLFMRAVESSIDGVLIVSNATDEQPIVYANSAFTRITGFKEGEVRGRVPVDILTGQDTDPGKRNQFLLAFHEHHEVTISLTLYRKDGTTFDARTSISIVRDDHDHISHFLLLLEDVSAEEQGRREIDRMKDEFLTTAAHELRTPLASILGYTELMLHRRYNEDRQRDMMQTVLRQANLLSAIVSDLLDLSRIQARGELDINLSPVPLITLLTEAVANLHGLEPARRIEMGAIADVDVMADTPKLLQALGNLLDNARKFSEAEHVIELFTTEETDQDIHYAVVHIRDKGVGMTEEQLSQAFRRFYRADQSGNHPGTGLGLPLALEIARLHGGTVELDSTLSQGTTARLKLRCRS